MKRPWCLIRKIALSLCFSSAVRPLIQSSLRLPFSLNIVRAIESRGHYGLLAALSTERAPRGAVYLTTNGFSPGKTVQKEVDSESAPVVSGSTRSEKPVVNRLLSKVELESLLDNGPIQQTRISKYQYSTTAQRAYDNHHKIRHRRGVYFAVRGNTIDPKRIVVTFSQVNSFENDVRYPITHLARIADVELHESLVLAVQPRTDDSSAFSELTSVDAVAKYQSFIKDLLNHYNLAAETITWLADNSNYSVLVELRKRFQTSSSILLCGNIDGTSLQKYAPVTLAGLPGMEGNSKVDFGQPLHAPVDFLVATSVDSDALSSDLLGSVLTSQRNLVIIDFANAQDRTWSVGEATIDTLLRYSLGICSARPGPPVNELRAFSDDDFLGFQLRIDHDWNYSTTETQWFLEISYERMRYLLNLSEHRLPFVKYTNGRQRVAKNFALPNRVLGARSFNSELGIASHGVTPHTQR